MTVIAPLVILTVAALYHPLKLMSFDPVVAAAMGLPVVAFHYLLMGMLSATVVAGLKTTGVILVVAMVITPASAAYQLTNRFWVMLLLSGLFGAIAAVVGMSLAFVTNWPTGPAMVIVAAAIFVLAMLFSPSHGLVFDRLRRMWLSRHIQREDVLKSIYRIAEQGRPVNVADVATDATLSVERALTLIARMRGDGLIDTDPTTIRLTDAGRQRAIEIIRANENERALELEEEALAARHEFEAALAERGGN